ncbi:MAG: hypothetical protein IPF94_16795 [Betaproteobacteria bacterium]|nr:hypothetical protein [Betaproteobacteria bacterium]
MRILPALMLVCAAPAVLGQATTESRSKRALEALSDIDQQNREWRAARGVPLTEAERAVQAVSEALGRRDCAGVVVALNAGLAKAHAEVFTLAGALYQEGLCVKPNWERAVNLYQRAAATGYTAAAASLAAGYAAPVGGKDRAAALWWALRAKTALPADCAKVASLVDDPDRFVAALQAWPAGQLEQCAYVGAVMATLQAEAETSAPGLALGLGLSGAVRAAFVPASGRVDITDELTEGALPAGVTGDAVALAAERRTTRKDFVGALQQRAELALKRYERPAGLPADWRVEAVYVFRAGR